MIDPTLLNKVVSENLELKISRAFSQEQSMPDIVIFTSFISELFKYHPPEKISWNFACVVTTEKVDLSIGRLVHRKEVMENFREETCIIILNENQCLLCTMGQFNLQDKNVISYLFEHKIEFIWANGMSIPVTNPDSASYSIFAQPTFKDLHAALWQYYNKNARYSICSKISDSWINSDRLRFKPGPEHSLRDSLWIFLRSVLRGNPEVKREQNVDDDNPVDLKVTWKMSKAVALLEVKWLGKSFNLETRRKTSDYSERRAIEGAIQLRDYIRTSHEENTDIHFMGYLVLFDGRRQRIGEFDSVPTLEQAIFYRDKNIEYPEHLENDESLNLEYRFFLEPNLAC
ncbi:hypothetical protein [Brevibacillus sp. HB2.2]|uniref:hypothetical protein n=1 Tax=Brevibacillus sp. HB2.2 TaxID=2738846 RepID=UPI00156AF5EF|nr:hypothetical protein [Brevibacillus sp. HB2.2]NRS51446.1 hypothetical protein [Brevibacillus sp. HB2.2]